MLGQPSEKSPEMEQTIFDATGIDRVEQIRSKTCPPSFGCGKRITEEEYSSWGPATRKEASISGLCGSCQVKVFGGSTDD